MFNLNEISYGEIFSIVAGVAFVLYLDEREEKKSLKEEADAKVQCDDGLTGSFDEYGIWHENGYYDPNGNLIQGYYDDEGQLHQGFYNKHSDWIEKGMFDCRGRWLNYRPNRPRYHKHRLQVFWSK